VWNVDRATPDRRNAQVSNSVTDISHDRFEQLEAVLELDSALESMYFERSQGTFAGIAIRRDEITLGFDPHCSPSVDEFSPPPDSVELSYIASKACSLRISSSTSSVSVTYLMGPYKSFNLTYVLRRRNAVKSIPTTSPDHCADSFRTRMESTRHRHSCDECRVNSGLNLG